MADKKKIIYSEPADYFPKELRDEFIKAAKEREKAKKKEQKKK